MARRLEKTPVKAEMGAWNFIKSEFRNNATMWYCYCDCERTTRWIQPSTFKNSLMCLLCANDKKTEIYKAGKEALKEEERITEKDEAVAPVGQLSLADIPKEEQEDDFLFFPIEAKKEAEKPAVDNRKAAIEEEEALWITQIEHSFALRTEAVQKLKEIAKKWYSIK